MLRVWRENVKENGRRRGKERAERFCERREDLCEGFEEGGVLKEKGES